MNFSQILVMGGYGVYVWTAYAITLIVFGLNVYYALCEKKQIKKSGCQPKACWHDKLKPNAYGHDKLKSKACGYDSSEKL
jgi:heme exporter protein CcmD